MASLAGGGQPVPGDLDRSEALALSITDPSYQAEALASLAGAAARCRGPRARPGASRQRRAGRPVYHRSGPAG